ncbi:hypothetical protein [Hymenobacter volaticus]|uniref:Uncharacterized protein n=1 Tax=Hymenobacter volaticus TaxID=2932254 RepID=A0ABY4GF08_9BACT|nr:hypothetical protein [Hymenobacter volaticus]UOQ69522.1 hypothetical protein MUN86_28185 [Hymenobacter volaticus]
MTTSRAAFCALPLAQQAGVLFTEGTLLASRWEGSRAVGLYQVGDFYCELCYDTTTYALLWTRPLQHSEGFAEGDGDAAG